MKKIIWTIGIVFSFLTVASAQENLKKTSKDVIYGAKAGVNIANIVGDDAGNANSFVGFNAGLFVQVPLNNKLFLQPEILYSAQGSKSSLFVEGSNYDAILKINYINVPVLLKYYIDSKFALEAGPYVGFLTSAKVKVKGNGISETVDVKDAFKSVDFGLGFGFNYDFSDKVFANARYSAGLSKIGDSGTDDDVKNSVFQIGLGFKF